MSVDVARHVERGPTLPAAEPVERALRIQRYPDGVAQLFDVYRDLLTRALRQLQAWRLARLDRHQRQRAPFGVQLELGRLTER